MTWGNNTITRQRLDDMMNVVTLRLILLLAKAGMTRPNMVAKALNRQRVTAYRWLVWRKKPLKTADRLALLYLAGVSEDALSAPVSVTPEQIAGAVRWYQLDVSEAELRTAVEDVPGLAELFEGCLLKARR